jgi:hypothetical protein
VGDFNSPFSIHNGSNIHKDKSNEGFKNMDNNEFISVPFHLCSVSFLSAFNLLSVIKIQL